MRIIFYLALFCFVTLSTESCKPRIESKQKDKKFNLDSKEKNGLSCISNYSGFDVACDPILLGTWVRSIQDEEILKQIPEDNELNETFITEVYRRKDSDFIRLNHSNSSQKKNYANEIEFYRNRYCRIGFEKNSRCEYRITKDRDKTTVVFLNQQFSIEEDENGYKLIASKNYRPDD